MIQLQAAYFLEGIDNIFLKEPNNELDKLKKRLSFFDLETDSNIEVYENIDSVVATINNMLIRGLPTIPSTFIEDILSTTFHKTRKAIKGNSFSYNFINDEYKTYIYRALHIIEPRLTLDILKNKISIDKSDQEKELKEKFLFDILPTQIGEYFIQLLSRGRDFKSIFCNSEYLQEDLKLSDYSFLEDKIDFSLETPYENVGKVGFILEINKSQYVDNTNYLKEDQKDEKLNKIKWSKTLRINKVELDNIDEKIADLQHFTYNKYFDNLRRNYESPIYNTNSGLDALQLALSPLAIARVQKTILQFILSNNLDMNAKQWDIAVIERDVPAAFLSIEDLKKQFAKLFLLEGKNRKLPKINLAIYYSEEFKKSELNILYQGEKKLISNFDANKNYDILIDLSVLEYSGLVCREIKTNAKHFVTIRSANYINSKRQFLTTDLINYQAIINNKPNKTEIEEDKEIELQDSITYFLRNVFRKNIFNNQEFDFINKTLQLENVLRNNPYDEQKTILYQFASILQPAISLIVNPNMTIMKEQFEGLKKRGIDGTYYINSSQTKVYDKQKAIQKFTNNESLFSFISADRFEIEDFRNNLAKMTSANSFFGYLIIDGIHSLSEYSHDLINSYSTIYQNVKQFAKTKNIETIPVIGFTATASYDVIYDVKLKIDFKDENIFNQTANFNHLNFKFAESLSYNTLSKENYLIENLKIPNDTLLYSNSPNELLQKLKYNNPQKNIATYLGTTDNQTNSISEIEGRESYQNYKDFKINKIDLLIANPNLAIDIEKKNINNGMFFNNPNSVENFIEQISIIAKNRESANCTFLVDKKMDKNIFKKKYKNRIKDISIANEILTEINYPSVNLSNTLINRVEKEFGKKINLVTQPSIEPTQLFIYNKNEDVLFGYIDYESNKIKIKSSEFKKEIAERIILFVKKEIENIIDNKNNLFEILNKKTKKESQKGLDEILKDLKIGEKGNLIISFINDNFERIQNIINNKLEKNINSEIIANAYDKSYDFEGFINFLSSKSSLRKENLSNDLQKEILSIYKVSRNFNETHKILQRFLNIGIIDYFTINYSTQEFSVFFTKKEEQEYYKNVIKNIKPFTSKENYSKIFNEMPNYEGNTAINKSIDCYTDFIYNSIISKHENSFEQINNIISDKNMDSNKIINFATNYFSAKYLEELKLIPKKDFSKIKDIIETVGNKKDNWLHLHKSTKILLEKEPQNYIFLILNGYSTTLLNYQNKEKLNNSLQKITDGFSIMRLDDNLQNDKYIEYIEWFKEKLFENNFDIKNKIKPIFLLKLHNSWIHNFNKRFLQTKTS